MERAIEGAIELLDRMDGDPDLEPEPLEMDSDFELGYAESGPDQRFLRVGVS